VLYIALAVQARAGANLMIMAFRFASNRLANPPIRIAAFLSLALIVTGIVIGGAGADLLAIVTLYKGRIRSGVGPVVLWLTMFLVVAVATGPVLDYFRTGNREGRAITAGEEQQDSEPATKPQHPATGKQSATPPPEPGETDPA
jgi:hypothetical protein